MLCAGKKPNNKEKKERKEEKKERKEEKKERKKKRRREIIHPSIHHPSITC